MKRIIGFPHLKNVSLNVIILIFASSLSSLLTFFLIATDRGERYPYFDQLKQLSIRLGNSLRYSVYNNSKWKYNNELLFSYWYVIDKRIIRAIDFLERSFGQFSGSG